MSGDEEDYVPDGEEDYVLKEGERAHKKRKIETHDEIEAASSPAGVDLGEALAIAEGAPDQEAKKAVGDKESSPKSMDAPPSTFQASTAVDSSAKDGDRQHSITQSDDSCVDSDLTPSPSGNDGTETREAPSPSKRARKRKSKRMDPQHTSYRPLTDSEESGSEAESTSRRETARRTNMQNGYETEVEVLVQDTKRSTPVYRDDSDGSISDSSDSEGSLYSGSTEESTTIVEGAPEEPEVRVDGLETESKSVRRKSRRMRRIQRDNLPYKPSPSSESEGDVERLLEREETKERERRRRKALRKARRTREKRASLAVGTVVDANTSIQSRKRKRPSDAVHETGRGHKKLVEDSIGDSEPKRKRVKKEHHPAEMDKFTPITNGATQPYRALQVEPVENGLKLPEPLNDPGQKDVTLASHKSVILDAPFLVGNEKDKNEAGAWWFGRLFSKKST